MFSTEVAKSMLHDLAKSPDLNFKEIQSYHTSRWYITTINRICTIFWPRIPQHQIDVHSTIYAVKSLIDKHPLVLKDQAAVGNLVNIIEKLEDSVSQELNQQDERQKTLYSFVLSIQCYVMSKSCLSVLDVDPDQTVLTLQKRLNKINILYYLYKACFLKNVFLAKACMSYIIKEYKKDDFSKYIINNLEMASLFHAACLAENEEILCFIFNNFRKDIGKIIESNSNLNFLFNKRDFSDATFILKKGSEERWVFVNRTILAQRSDYFRGLFNLESQSEYTFDFTLPEYDFTPEIFEVALLFIYQTDVNVTTENIKQLLAIARFFQLPALESLCIKSPAIESQAFPGLWHNVWHRCFAQSTTESREATLIGFRKYLQTCLFERNSTIAKFYLNSLKSCYTQKEISIFVAESLETYQEEKESETCITIDPSFFYAVWLAEDSQIMKLFAQNFAKDEIKKKLIIQKLSLENKDLSFVFNRTQFLM